MFDVLLTATVIAAAGFLGFELGKKIGYEEAQAEMRSRRLYAGR